MEDWNPKLYADFADLRLRPALDLLARVPDLPPGEIVDLGCGTGAIAPALRRRFAGRALIGLDASPAMQDKARATGLYDQILSADAGEWSANSPPALIFSNALLHWLPDHETLLPRLARMLAAKGTLAIQMPNQFDAPSHRLLREVSERLFPDRFCWSAWHAPVTTQAEYHRTLEHTGDLSIWQTEYLQRLDPVEDGHPVRHFTRSTAMRPVAEKLTERELAAFLRAYDRALDAAYPTEADGAVLFPFKRLFLVLTKR